MRIDDDYRADPRLLPGSLRRDYRAIGSWAPAYRGKVVVVVCHRGQKLSEGTAAWLDVNSISGGIQNSLAAAGGPEQSDETVKVTVRSYSGDVIIRRSERAAA